jgi:hypothetical protein
MKQRVDGGQVVTLAERDMKQKQDVTMPVSGGAGPEAEAYRWSAPDGRTVLLPYDVLDRLGYDIMRGFGAVPKRGAEVGGLLLGRWQPTEPPTAVIEDYLLVPCSHAKGPSFLLTDSEVEALDQIAARAVKGGIPIVGFFRSHTRDPLELTDEDLELLEKRLPDPHSLILLVRPYATKPPQATFFYRTGGSFQHQPAGETFVFRRQDLGGGRPRRRQRPSERDTEAASANPPAESVPDSSELPSDFSLPNLGGLAPAVPPLDAEAARRIAQEPRTRTNWIWIPLSFIFLLLGIVLGFQIAISFRPTAQAKQAADPYSLNLSVTPSRGSVHLRWSADSAAVQQAVRGILHIQDGDNAKSVSLSREDLLRGGVLYRNATGSVAFRLEVFPHQRASVSETAEIRTLEGSSIREIPANPGSRK